MVAPADRHDAAGGTRPRVSVVIPARDEARHIEACIRSILAQSIEGGLEVIVADGRSTDRTVEVARAAGATVVPNEAITTPAGLNAALASAGGEIVIRFDAHAEMPPGYVRACVRALVEEQGAASVGGWRETSADGAWGTATAAALSSRFGVGNPRLWRRPQDGSPRLDVDTVALGCWWAHELREVGGWDPRFRRNQDFELNYRLRRRGGRVVFDPAIWSTYHPRESLRALARQYWDYGRYKALLLKRAPRSLRPRQLAPVILLATGIAALTRSRLARPARGGLGLYGAVLAAVAARSSTWRTVPVLATMHWAWAVGLATGLLKSPRESFNR
jgi:glycosyltransferase involved in cell wall biosynthesis